MSSPLLSVQGLTVDYAGAGALRAVDDVSFDVQPGEVVGLIGESGSGKTTIARAILRLLPSNASVSGEIRFDDIDLRALPARGLRPLRWKRLAFVPQSAMNSLDPVRKVGRQLADVIRAHESVSRADAWARARAALASVGIDPGRADDYPHQFSGGMRQRALIAMSTILKPQLLIADEPTTGLDVVVQDQVLGELQRVCRTEGIAAVFVTHDLGVAAEMCSRLVVMRHGRAVEAGSVEDVLLRPHHDYTQELLESAQADLVGSQSPALEG
jgi:ABC-type glutathione transport system ATPase component